jgi:hypothetical protein
LKKVEPTLGRRRVNTIRINAPGVSGQHASFIPTVDGWLVHDSNSTNGVWVNNTRIKADTFLNHGDVIEIGGVNFRYETLTGVLAGELDNVRKVAIESNIIDPQELVTKAVEETVHPFRRRLWRYLLVVVLLLIVLLAGGYALLAHNANHLIPRDWLHKIG